MSSYSKNDAPAAKVVMRVPTPDSLVEVMVSPPDSNFEVKVAPGEEIIELHIRAGSNSYVEVRICPPVDNKILDKPAQEAHISIAGSAMDHQSASAAEPIEKIPETSESAPLSLSFASDLLDAADSALGARLENLDQELILEDGGKRGIQKPYTEDTAAAPVTRLAAETGPRIDDHQLELEDIKTAGADAGQSIISTLSADDESGQSPDNNPFPQADISGIPGPDPALFADDTFPGQSVFSTNRLPAGAGAGAGAGAWEDDTFSPEFIEIDDDSSSDGFSSDNDQIPFGLVNEAAKVALARLSAAVEMEKAEMAANPGVWSPETAGPPLESDIVEEEMEMAGPLDVPPASLPPIVADLPPRSPEASHSRARKMLSADTTIMVQMYEDVAVFAPAADTATPLSEEEEMEIGPLEDELSIEPIDMDQLDDLDLDYSQMPGRPKERSIPKAKHLSTVVPGNTIIPK